MSQTLQTAAPPAAEPVNVAPAKPLRKDHKLTDPLKTRVVTWLALDERPTDIARRLKREHGIDISRKAISYYDPRRYPECTAEWAALFWAIYASVRQAKGEVVVVPPPRDEAAVAPIVPELTAAWTPEPSNPPQVEAYHSKADLLLYGGAAGGGKTDLLIGLALTAHERSVIFRRAYVDLARRSSSG